MSNKFLNNSVLSKNKLNMSTTSKPGGEANSNDRMVRLSEKLGKITVMD